MNCSHQNGDFSVTSVSNRRAIFVDPCLVIFAIFSIIRSAAKLHALDAQTILSVMQQHIISTVCLHQHQLQTAWAMIKEADAAGFSEEGLFLGKGVLESMARQAAEQTMVFPQSDSAREVMRLFMTRHESGGGYVLGNLSPAKGLEPSGKDYERFREMNGGGIWLSGWGLFKPALSKLVKEDIGRMLLPMMALLLGMMFVIFRRAADVGIALFAMVISTLLLLAIMSAAGLKWNFVNLMATPLLLGTGIDYAIHVTLTIRRTGGCFKELWNGTGKALLFCGVSNVIGFGSLIWSSSEALVSLGVVAVIGITLSMAISLFLLPGWKAQRED
ncbi:MAG: MMPL family transporter, partial [Verrucomicrobiales bacterium]